MCEYRAVGICRSCGLGACSSHILSGHGGSGPQCTVCCHGEKPERDAREKRDRLKSDKYLMELYAALQGISSELNRHGVTFEWGKRDCPYQGERIIFLKKGGGVNTLSCIFESMYFVQLDPADFSPPTLGVIGSAIETVNDVVRKIKYSIISEDKLPMTHQGLTYPDIYPFPSENSGL